MRIVIIGSGNVATVIGRLISRSNHQVVQVVSRTIAHAKALAEELNCPYSTSDDTLDTSADIYIVAVSDGALYELNKSFHLGSKLILHTAGSVPKDVLKDISLNYGVLYPLQSLRKEMEFPDDIPFLVDGSSQEIITFTEDFAATLSGKVSKASDEERLKLHVAAVVVSNFTNHLYALAEEFCQKEYIDFKLLAPLIKETATRIATHSPALVQTGPAVRNDVFTLDKHLRLLANYPRLKYIYLKLTDSIMKEG
jgi:predicted short-subunit dehydrogenase-like oxidoreductase (DUF2520 family)